MAELTYENIATQSIVEGFESGIQTFMEDLESNLRNSVIIEEVGSVDAIIEESAKASFEELDQKLASALTD